MEGGTRKGNEEGKTGEAGMLMCVRGREGWPHLAIRVGAQVPPDHPAQSGGRRRLSARHSPHGKAMEAGGGMWEKGDEESPR
jgi:hypothetical protein